MNAGTQLEPMQIFGLYELDDAGTVLYSRPNEYAGRDASRSIIGQNFFEEMGETGSFRREFKNFIHSHRPVGSFLFDGGPVKAKVSLTRGHETHDAAAGGIVIMVIREQH
jgi:hypothetical protein